MCGLVWLFLSPVRGEGGSASFSIKKVSMLPVTALVGRGEEVIKFSVFLFIKYNI